MPTEKPTNEIIRIAEATVNLPSTGKVNKQLPSYELRTVGYDKNKRIFAEELNYTLDNIGAWCQYFEDITDLDMQDLSDFKDEVYNRDLVAGDGLTGGGDLSSDRTFNMGTPSTLDGVSTNKTTNESHTHELVIATTPEAQAGTDDKNLMTPRKVMDSITSRFTGTSSDDFVIYPNGLIEQWLVHPLGATHVWEEVELPTPLTIEVKNIALVINDTPGGAANNSDVAARPSTTNPLTHIEIYPVGQSGDVMVSVKGY